jgi:hypothetical protein
MDGNGETHTLVRQPHRRRGARGHLLAMRIGRRHGGRQRLGRIKSGKEFSMLTPFFFGVHCFFSSLGSFSFLIL